MVAPGQTVALRAWQNKKAKHAPGAPHDAASASTTARSNVDHPQTVTFSAYATATATFHAVQALRPGLQECRCDTRRWAGATCRNQSTKTELRVSSRRCEFSHYRLLVFILDAYRCSAYN